MSTKIAEKSSDQKNLRQAAQDFSDKTKSAGAAGVNVSRVAYRNLQNAAADCTRKTDRAVRGNPYLALAAVFCTGLALGFFMSRPKRDDED